MENKLKIIIFTLIAVICIVILLFSIFQFSRHKILPQTNMSTSNNIHTPIIKKTLSENMLKAQVIATSSLSTMLETKPQESTIIPSGKIIFREHERLCENKIRTNYYLINGDGNDIEYLGSFSGSMDISRDGKFLAVGCEDPSKICIVDLNSVVNHHKFPIDKKINYDYEPTIINKINIPEECKSVLSDSNGLASISWSNDGKQLAIVCSRNSVNNQELKSQVCMLKLDGSVNCWGEIESKDIIRVIWSPVNSELLVDLQGRINIVNSVGKINFSLSGFSPTWSPDGKKIAFSGYYGDGPRNGIAVIDRDGTNLIWLYKQPINGEREEYLCPICCYSYLGSSCKIAWSPDGKYLAFSASYLGDYLTDIFRLNIETGEIILLAGFPPYSNYVDEPTWGP